MTQLLKNSRILKDFKLTQAPTSLWFKSWRMFWASKNYERAQVLACNSRFD